MPVAGSVVSIEFPALLCGIIFRYLLAASYGEFLPINKLLRPPWPLERPIEALMLGVCREARLRFWLGCLGSTILAKWFMSFS